MDPILGVSTTWWTDYTQGLTWTIPGHLNTFIQLVIGLSFGLAQPCLERLVAHLFGWFYYAIRQHRHRRLRETERPGAPNENTSLINGSNSKNRKSRSCHCFPCRRNKFCSRNFIAKTSSLLIVIFGITYNSAGTFVNAVPMDKAALSASRKCGLWGLRDDAMPAAKDEDALIQGQRETRAGQYAKDCYCSQSATSLNQCLIFKTPRITTSKTVDGLECPFVNKTYCAGDGFTASRFSTGLVDATSIGVNARNAPKFNRTTICVPLNIYQGFVEKASSEPGHWGYKLGPVSSDEYKSNYTFRQYGDPFTYDVRSYTMSTYVHVYSKSTSQNYWMPIPELNIRSDLNTASHPYSLTIMFINSCRIFYKEQSDDPIFPADSRWPRNPDLFTNNDSRARPLACIDWIEVCTHQGKCQPSFEDVEKRDKYYVFTKHALNKSTTFHATEFRGATSLLAQDRIKDDTSLPLDRHPTQWIAESRSFFDASLSRIQYDALDIANGTGWDKEPQYDQKMPKWAQGKVCSIFTFQLPNGYVNIRVWPTVGILAVPLALWLLGRKTNEELDEEKKRLGNFEDNKLIGLEWAFWKMGAPIGKSDGRISTSAHSVNHNNDGQNQAESEGSSVTR